MTSGDDRTTRLVDDFLQRRIDRRQFLRRAVAGGLSLSAASALLAACGGEEEAAAPPPPAEPPPAEPAPAEPPPAEPAPAEPPAEPPAAGPTEASGPLRIRLTADIINLDPAFYPGGVDEIAMFGIYEGLVRYAPGTWDLVNQLAETFEPSPDGLQFAFKLKEGIQFHGGYGEVTAEDVKFSYERIAGLTTPPLDPESPYKGDWAPHLQEVRVDDTYSGTIILKEPFAPLLATTLPVPSGWILSKKAVEERGEDYATSPIGTGPYEFVEWQPKQQVRLQRFADYSGASADTLGTIWDELVLVPIEEDEAAAIAIETGELDFGEITGDAIQRFSENSDFTVEQRTTLDYTWIGMNISSPRLEDINVRQAIRYAIDVPGILEAAFEGQYERATAILPPGMPIGYWADAPVYERDLDQANQLLSQASNPPTQLDYKFTEETGSRATGEIVQANLAEIGIEVTLTELDSSAYYALEPEEMRSRDLFFVGFITNPDPSWSTVWFVCDQIDVWNWMYWCDEEYDRLHYAALQESDPAARNDMYIQMQQRWDEAAHTVWLGWPTRYYAARQGIEQALRPDARILPTAFNAV
jgi:peptide/nickel transport system substrate-binding protein